MDNILAGGRYSVTTDEYTSTQNKRFSAVNLHPSNGRPIKIGMMRIYGSLPGEKAASDLKKKLHEYGLKEDHHTVANTTDAASVMKKMGRQFLSIHQLCYSHGIHLAGTYVNILVGIGITELCHAVSQLYRVRKSDFTLKME